MCIVDLQGEHMLSCKPAYKMLSTVVDNKSLNWLVWSETMLFEWIMDLNGL